MKGKGLNCMTVHKGKNTVVRGRLHNLINDPLWLYMLGITSLSFLLADSAAGYLLSSLLLGFTLVSIYILYIGGGTRLHDRVLQQLSSFNNQYTIISSVELTDGSKKGFFDYILLSPKGIFNIRVLDFEGTMTGYENDEYWDYVKVISPYDVIRKRVNNPLHFLQYSHGIIEGLLERQHIKYIPLQSFFVVNNSDATIETNSYVPIVRVKELADYIENHQDRSNMTAILKELEELFLSGPHIKYKASSLSTEG